MGIDYGATELYNKGELLAGLSDTDAKPIDFIKLEWAEGQHESAKQKVMIEFTKGVLHKEKADISVQWEENLK